MTETKSGHTFFFSIYTCSFNCVWIVSAIKLDRGYIKYGCLWIAQNVVWFY